MRNTLTALTLALLASPGWSAAQIVDIAWSADNRFEHRAVLAPRQVLEVCGRLPPGSTVSWSFDSSAALPFNIHVHQGKDVVYLAQLERADRGQARQVFEAEPAHCWMWTNKTVTEVVLNLNLQR